MGKRTEINDKETKINGKKYWIHALPAIRCPQITLPAGKGRILGIKIPKCLKLWGSPAAEGFPLLNPAGCNFVSWTSLLSVGCALLLSWCKAKFSSSDFKVLFPIKTPPEVEVDLLCLFQGFAAGAWPNPNLNPARLQQSVVKEHWNNLWFIFIVVKRAQNSQCASHRLLKMLGLALPYWNLPILQVFGQGRGLGNAVFTCGFPNSCSSSWCWPHLWVCVFPSAKTQCQPRPCCFSRRKILLPLLKICLAEPKFPSPSPVLGRAGMEWRIWGGFCCFQARGSLGMCLMSVLWLCRSQGRGGTAKGTLTRKHNKRRRMKPSRVNTQMRMMAQNWSSEKGGEKKAAYQV